MPIFEVNELPEGTLLAGGKPVTEPTFKVDVTTPEGALSDRRRAELVAEATRVVREVTGIGDEGALRIWVLLHEVAEGRWGAGGSIIQFQQLIEAATAQREGQSAEAAVSA
jgi:phenylpyruvate tautomerase PptA (4-oxalocrotonate tautomerase family)